MIRFCPEAATEIEEALDWYLGRSLAINVTVERVDWGREQRAESREQRGEGRERRGFLVPSSWCLVPGS
jgi:hypothetical protein